MKTALQMQTFFHDRNQNVNCDSGPDLRFDGVLRGAVKSFDPQMLLDPAKEQFDFPTTLIELGDGQSRQEKVVGEKDKTFLARPIEVSHAAKPFGIAPLGNRIVEHHDLIALQTRLFLHSLRIQTSTVESFFRTSHKERSTLMHTVESFEIEIAAVHQVNGSGLPDQLIEDVDLVDLSTRDDHHRRNTAAKIEKGGKIDCGFVSSKLRPREKVQTQIDGGSVQGIHRVVEFEPKGFALVESTRLLDQSLGKVGVDAPVSDLIGVG